MKSVLWGRCGPKLEVRRAEPGWGSWGPPAVGSGERCKLPQGSAGQSPDRQEFAGQKDTLAPVVSALRGDGGERLRCPPAVPTPLITFIFTLTVQRLLKLRTLNKVVHNDDDDDDASLKDCFNQSSP